MTKRKLLLHALIMVLISAALSVCISWARGWSFSPFQYVIFIGLSAITFVLTTISLDANRRGKHQGKQFVTSGKAADAAIARVFINDVEVGSISAANYYEIVRASRKELKLWVLQGFNWLTVIYTVVVSVFRFIPMLWFVAFTFVMVFAPTSMTDIFSNIQKASPADLTNGFRNALYLSSVFGVVALAVSSVMGVGTYRYGYANQFDQQIALRIRELLEVPAEGKMMISIIGNSTGK